MQRTNISIKREIMRLCRKHSISYTYNYNCPVLRICNVITTIQDGYICHIFWRNNQRLVYQIRYESFDSWYIKFDCFRRSFHSVFIAKPKNDIYGLQSKKNTNN